MVMIKKSLRATTIYRQDNYNKMKNKSYLVLAYNDNDEYWIKKDEEKIFLEKNNPIWLTIEMRAFIGNPMPIDQMEMTNFNCKIVYSEKEKRFTVDKINRP